MRVRLKTSVAGPDISIRPRDVVDVPDGLGGVWIERGDAETAGGEPVTAEWPGYAETATKKPTEKAVKKPTEKAVKKPRARKPKAPK